MKNKIHILCLFDYFCTTGFSTVSHNIIQELKRHYRDQLYLDIVAVNYYAQGIEPDPQVRIYPAAKCLEKDNRHDAYGRTAYLALLQEENYDGTFIIQDPMVVRDMAVKMKEIKAKKRQNNRKDFKSIFYFPIDGTPYPDDFDTLDVFDKLVTYTEFGRKEVLKLRPELRGSKLEVIPHGVNPKNFYVIDAEKVKRFRKEYFGAGADKIIITNINRNQPRKDIPTTITSFIEYKEQYNPDSFLYLHMTPHDGMGWNLPRVLRQTSLVEGRDYAFCSKEMYDAGADMETLNYIYNASDVFLTTTSGEGWGLTITEAMMCRCPVIAPGHSSISEIGGHGERIFELEQLYPYCTHFDSMFRWQCDYQEVAATINEVVHHPEQVKEKLDAASRYIQTIHWEKICKRWVDLFERVF